MTESDLASDDVHVMIFGSRKLAIAILVLTVLLSVGSVPVFHFTDTSSKKGTELQWLSMPNQNGAGPAGCAYNGGSIYGNYSDPFGNWTICKLSFNYTEVDSYTHPAGLFACLWHGGCW